MKIKRNVLSSYWCETDYCRGGVYEPPSCVHTRHNPGARCAVLLTDYPGTRPERLETIEQLPSCVHTRHIPGARCALLLTDYPGTRPERL